MGLSLALNPNKRPEPVKFFLRCTLTTIGQMKGRENVGLFILDYKNTPDEMVSILGRFLETQERYKAQYEDFGKKQIRMTAETSKLLGFNMYATVSGPTGEPRRIQIFNLNSKFIEHMEAAGAPVLPVGTPVSYQLYFQKFRIGTTGTVNGAAALPQGIIRTIATLDFSPELVEILDEYWSQVNTNAGKKLNLL